MISTELDNPVWHALNGAHRHLAQCHAHCAWYPSDIAPFLAVPAAQALPDLDGAGRRNLAAPAYCLGVLPHALPAGWKFSAHSQVLQMIPSSECRPADDDECKVLGPADRAAMLDLAGIAFPDFFRARTGELGQYLGIFASDKLVAMAGERLRLTNLQEISGVCTHPNFSGRGYARRLTCALLQRHLQRGVGSFLHVSESNEVARRIYDSMGFRVRSSLTMGKIERVPGG
jgi:GNAT superfamily N-acetyltransferase